MISILLPARNAESTILRALRSTLTALPDNAEILVHDDASSDDTVEIINSIHDRRIRLFTSTTTQGVAGGLNLLLNHARFDLVGRMDADDVCLPWRFRYTLRRMPEDWQFAFTGVLHFGNRRRITAPVMLGPEAFNLTLLLENPFAHPTLVAKTDSILASGGYTQCSAEDYELWLRLITNRARGGRLAAPTVLYRNHPSQTTATQDWREKALSEDTFKSTYKTFAQTVFDAEATWLDELIAHRRASPAGHLDDLWRIIDSGAQRLPIRQAKSVLTRTERVRKVIL